jgi:hypothetical protein
MSESEPRKLLEPCGVRLRAGAQCQDAFFEQHATTYFALLQAQIS